MGYFESFIINSETTHLEIEIISLGCQCKFFRDDILIKEIKVYNKIGTLYDYFLKKDLAKEWSEIDLGDYFVNLIYQDLKLFETFGNIPKNISIKNL